MNAKEKSLTTLQQCITKIYILSTLLNNMQISDKSSLNLLFFTKLLMFSGFSRIVKFTVKPIKNVIHAQHLNGG